jgi:hypothetical protein
MKRSTTVQLGILLVLAIAAFFALRRQGETSSSGESGTPLVTFDSSAVDRIELGSARTMVTLQRDGNTWRIIAPIQYPADEAAVKAVLEKGRHIQLENVVSTNPQKQDVFQVDSTGTLVRIFQNGSEKAAFIVGKASSSYTETFVRKESSNDVYLASGVLTYAFNKPVKDWRDKSIYKADQGSIREVHFKYGDTTFTLANRDSLWRVDGDSASFATVRSFLGAIANFQTDDFIDTTVRTLPRLRATLDVDGTQIRFYYEKDGSKYLVQSSRSAQLFEVQNWRASQVLKKKKDFTVTPA